VASASDSFAFCWCDDPLALLVTGAIVPTARIDVQWVEVFYGDFWPQALFIRYFSIHVTSNKLAQFACQPP